MRLVVLAVIVALAACAVEQDAHVVEIADAGVAASTAKQTLGEGVKKVTAAQLNNIAAKKHQSRNGRDRSFQRDEGPELSGHTLRQARIQGIAQLGARHGLVLSARLPMEVLCCSLWAEGQD